MSEVTYTEKWTIGIKDKPYFGINLEKSVTLTFDDPKDHDKIYAKAKQLVVDSLMERVEEICKAQGVPDVIGLLESAPIVAISDKGDILVHREPKKDYGRDRSYRSRDAPWQQRGTDKYQRTIPKKRVM